MKVRLVLASLVAATLVLGGCIAAPVVPPVGMVYTDFDAPLGAGPREAGSKTGRSSVTAILQGANARLHGINWEVWLAFCRRDGGCTPEELRGLVEHAEAHDHFTSLTEHLRLLKDAGFEDLDCLWRNWIWGIVAARRP